MARPALRGLGALFKVLDLLFRLAATERRREAARDH
jgi:hypothetical protein